MLKSKSNEFIPKNILSKNITINYNFEKYERYTIYFNINNNNNNWYYALGISGIKNIVLWSCCIYININKTRQNSYLKLISTINNF